MVEQLELEDSDAGRASRLVCEALEPFDRLTQMRIMEAVCILLGEDDLAAVLHVARTAEQAAQARAQKQDA